jgi:hypothetical protein
MEALGGNDQLRLMSTAGSSASETALSVLHDAAPLHELLEPLVQKLSAGLGGMGRIVGSSTPSEDITPDLLAVSMLVKERCDKEVVLPLLEMKEVVEARRKELKIMYNNQLALLKSLQDTVNTLKERMDVIRDKSEIVGTNATSLAQRSSSVLQSSNDLLPTITQAEHDYFQELKMLNTKCQTWAAEYERLNKKVHDLRDSLDEGNTAGELVLEPALVENANRLLEADGILLKKHTVRLKDSSQKVKQLAAISGFDLEPDKPLPMGQ